SKINKEVLMTTPSRSKKINESWSAAKRIANVTTYTPVEALAFLMEAGLTKHSYQIIWTQAKSRGADIYPSYNKVREAKAECYPPKESVHITETKSEIELQALLDLTVRRIIQLQSEIILRLPKNMYNNIHLISKWGCDGSSGHSLY
ncbi:hypothetical protein EAI_01483, partial [Harpegnathos saltator]